MCGHGILLSALQVSVAHKNMVSTIPANSAWLQDFQSLNNSQGLAYFNVSSSVVLAAPSFASLFSRFVSPTPRWCLRASEDIGITEGEYTANHLLLSVANMMLPMLLKCHAILLVRLMLDSNGCSPAMQDNVACRTITASLHTSITPTTGIRLILPDQPGTYTTFHIDRICKHKLSL